MVDWRWLLVNALWVLGLSLVLVGLCIKSYVGLLATTAHDLRGQECAHVVYLGRSAPIVLRIGLILFCGSVLLLSTTAWERAVWALALVLALKHLAQRLSPAASTPEPSRRAVDNE